VTEETAKITKKYCGAVAVSWYGLPYTIPAIQHFINAGCITNIHYVLCDESIDEAIQILEKDDLPNGVNAIIFLLYKPIHQKNHHSLKDTDPRVIKLVDLVGKTHPFKIGFDSCSIPMLLRNGVDANPMSLEPCEGARVSAYISPQGTMTPCSFDQNMEYGVSLFHKTIKQAWDTLKFDKFRARLKPCKGTFLCKYHNDCLGTCPFVNMECTEAKK
jgi:radical SAM protein with 4Fe4S-binding SPASM domain